MSVCETQVKRAVWNSCSCPACIDLDEYFSSQIATLERTAKTREQIARTLGLNVGVVEQLARTA
jgi:hypothetical protein